MDNGSKTNTQKWVEENADKYFLLSDKIYQPTPNPIKKNVTPFFFHAYNQDWENPGNYNNKKYGMVYVGLVMLIVLRSPERRRVVQLLKRSVKR